MKKSRIEEKYRIGKSEGECYTQLYGIELSALVFWGDLVRAYLCKNLGPDKNQSRSEKKK